MLFLLQVRSRDLISTNDDALLLLMTYKYAMLMSIQKLTGHIIYIIAIIKSSAAPY